MKKLTNKELQEKQDKLRQNAMAKFVHNCPCAKTRYNFTRRSLMKEAVNTLFITDTVGKLADIGLPVLPPTLLNHN